MRWRRQTNITYPREQIFFALEYLLLAIGFVVLSAFLLFVPPFNRLFGGEELAETLAPLLFQLIFSQWLLICAAFVVILVIAVLLSNRLFGAMFGLRKMIAAQRAGEQKARAHMRKYDYLLPLGEELNALLDDQQRQRETLIGHAERLAQQAEASGNSELAKEAEAMLALLGAQRESS